MSSLIRFLFQIHPKVSRELKIWENIALTCPDQNLKLMALSSLKHKRFHCQGGSFFALWADKSHRKKLIKAIIALQTISDYLDNLCDRAGIQDEKAFQQLHYAFLDALCPGTLSNYYFFYPHQSDGGYLTSLVKACQDAVSIFPSYQPVKEKVFKLARLYCSLQIYKHLNPKIREQNLITWLNPLLLNFNHQLYWWELAAASGSTLGIFALMALATRRSLSIKVVDDIYKAYFPWIGGLHILLDYFIDQEEDRSGGDLNFIFYYTDSQEIKKRLLFFLTRALDSITNLPDHPFHKLIVEGLPALYLSDPKIIAQNFLPTANYLLNAAGLNCRKLYWYCRTFRRAGII